MEREAVEYGRKENGEEARRGIEEREDNKKGQRWTEGWRKCKSCQRLPLSPEKNKSATPDILAYIPILVCKNYTYHNIALCCYILFVS